MQHLNQFDVLFQSIPKIFLTYAKNKIEDFKLHVGKCWGNFFIVKKCDSWAY